MANNKMPVALSSPAVTDEPSTIPPFSADGLLPIGIWKASESDFEAQFVASFPTSPTRRKIYEGFARLRGEIADLELLGWHWVDGSFVTTKNDPEDVDIVTFSDGDQLETFDAEQQTDILDLLDGHALAKPTFDCDTYYVAVRREGDPLYREYVRLRQGKLELFGKTNFKKTGIDLPKGFLELAIQKKGRPALTAVINESHEEVREKTVVREVDWSAADLEHHLVESRSILESLEASGDTRFSTRLQIASLRKEIDKFQQTLAAAKLLESNADAELVIEGKPVIDHKVDAGFLGTLLARLQDTVEYLTTGNAPSKLQVLAFSPSSFKTSFVLVQENQEQPELPLEAEGTPGINILSRILDGQLDNVTVTNAVDDRPTKKAYVRLMRCIGYSGATVSFRTRENPYGSQISATEAKERYDWMSKLTVSIQPLSIVGELITGSLREGRFEIQASTGELYSGKTDKQAASQARGIKLGASVRATIEKITKNHIDMDAPQITYRLKEIADVSDPILDL